MGTTKSTGTSQGHAVLTGNVKCVPETLAFLDDHPGVRAGRYERRCHHFENDSNMPQKVLFDCSKLTKERAM